MLRTRSIMIRSAITLIGVVGLALLAAAPAFAAEGVLPVRAGDRVEGNIRRCGDRHVLAVELVRGEKLRVKVRPATDFVQDLTVRFYDPTGLLANDPANVRVNSGTTVVGPYRITDSGTHLLSITTTTRHGLPYEVFTKVKGRRGRSVRLKAGRDGRVVAAAGSVLRIRGLDDEARVTLRFPGGAAEILKTGSACLEALTGSGLTLPEGGTYGVSVSAGRAKLRIRAPGRTAVRTLVFPELPDDQGSVSAWYDDAGWVADPFASAPADHEPPVSVPVPGAPRPPSSTEVATLLEAPNSPFTPSARAVFGVATNPGGHQAGIGMPIAPIPTIDEALTFGTVEAFNSGPSYVYDVDRPGLGSVRYRVQFVVGGRAALAPVALNGNVTLRWRAEGGGTFHEETWALSFDAARDLEVLDGSATFIGRGFTTIRSSASGFALPVDGSAPYGTISWAIDSPTDGAFVRSEVHDGTGAVDVELR